MSHQPTIREQLDACRPESDDLQLPEFAGLAQAVRDDATVRAEWDRTQTTDRAVRCAMQEVSIPAGLAERILAALASAPSEAPLEAVVDRALLAVDPTEQPKVVVQPSREASPAALQRRFSRRIWFSLAGIAAVLLVGFTASQFWPTTLEVVSRDDLALQAESWLTMANSPQVQWRAASDAPPLAGFPTGAVQGNRGRWTKLNLPTEPSVVAFELAQPGSRTKATLFVISTRREYKVNSLPYSRLGVSGKYTVGAWQKDGVLYVLALDEGYGDRLDNFVIRQPLG